MSGPFDALKERKKRNYATSFPDMETTQKNVRGSWKEQEAIISHAPL